MLSRERRCGERRCGERRCGERRCGERRWGERRWGERVGERSEGVCVTRRHHVRRRVVSRVRSSVWRCRSSRETGRDGTEVLRTSEVLALQKNQSVALLCCWGPPHHPTFWQPIRASRFARVCALFSCMQAERRELTPRLVRRRHGLGLGCGVGLGKERRSPLAPAARSTAVSCPACRCAKRRAPTSRSVFNKMRTRLLAARVNY